MNKEFSKLINKLQTKYSDMLSKDEIEEMLNIDDTAEDIPISTGKRLVIEYVCFGGKKQFGESIKFEEEFSSGINMIIADNLKGKSSVFKVIKTALVGYGDYIKQDIKKWIEYIILGFRINDKRYTISMLISSRIKGKLYNCSFKDYIVTGGLPEQIVFEASNNTEYEREIQRFFFNQFLYFSMKWTQKSSVKDSNDLIESSSSWKTYFKTIYLESRDSNSFYGGQDQKTFQVLLSLEHTQLVNRLTVKRELLQSDLANQKNAIESFGILKDNSDLQAELNTVNDKLDGIRNSNRSLQLIELKRKRKSLKSNISELNKRLTDLYTEYKTLMHQKDMKEKMFDGFRHEYNRISNEIIKTKRLINDIHEYLEVGQFFSALEVKYCPSCNHQVFHSDKEPKNICPLCHEEAIGDSLEEKENYSHKAAELQENIHQLLHEKNLLEEKKKDLLVEISNTESILEEMLRNISELEKNDSEEELDRINNLIEKIQSESDDDQEKALIAEQAVLMYKIDKDDNEQLRISDIDKLEAMIELLQDAIVDIDNLRFEKSQTIIDTLKNSMLREIHDFGLTSITDIEIDKKFNVIYIQNGVRVKFSDIAEGEQLRAKLAFYLSLIQLDIENNHGRHTRFLIIDSPNKEEGDTAYLEGLKEVLNQIQIRYQDQLQIIIGTATREFIGIVKNEKIYGEGEYLF